MNEHPDSPITLVEFCAGYCGLGLGIKRVLGERLRTVGYCELEGFAQANLISKMEAGHLDVAPLWPNLLQFPYAKFRGFVDIVAAGIPCQSHSHAGLRKGEDDHRFLFDDWLNGIELMRPELIFIENVEGLLSSKMRDGTLCIRWLIERLESMDCRVEVGLFSASEVGAPHQRKRVFILASRKDMAHRIGAGLERYAGDGNGRGEPGRQSPHENRSTGSGGLQLWPSGPSEPQHEWEPPRTVVGNAKKQSISRKQRRDLCTGQEANPQRQTNNDLVDRSGEALDLANSPGGRRQQLSNAGPPNLFPSETGTTKQMQQPGSVSPGGTESPRRLESALGRDSSRDSSGMDYAELCVSCDNRTDELRLLGNGCLPQTVEVAFRTLYARLFPC